jgi:four helix bundle protein
MANRVEELLVYQKAMEGVGAISALINRSAISKDWKFKDQLLDAAMGVPRNISEGFGQQTDRLFVRYLYIAKGMLNYISRDDLSLHGPIYEEIARMLTGLIKYLKSCDRRERG